MPRRRAELLPDSAGVRGIREDAVSEEPVAEMFEKSFDELTVRVSEATERTRARLSDLIGDDRLAAHLADEILSGISTWVRQERGLWACVSSAKIGTRLLHERATKALERSSQAQPALAAWFVLIACDIDECGRSMPQEKEPSAVRAYARSLQFGLAILDAWEHERRALKPASVVQEAYALAIAARRGSVSTESFLERAHAILDQIEVAAREGSERPTITRTKPGHWRVEDEPLRLVGLDGNESNESRLLAAYVTNVGAFNSAKAVAEAAGVEAARVPQANARLADKLKGLVGHPVIHSGQPRGVYGFLAPPERSQETG